MMTCIFPRKTIFYGMVLLLSCGEPIKAIEGSVTDTSEGQDCTVNGDADSDCDGVVFELDCDDADASLLAISDDGDCDGIVTALDCDDANANLGQMDNDLDCDGFLNADDCAETDPYIFPGAEEVCDGVDNNCNSEIDEGLLIEIYVDADGDGYGDDNQVVTACDDDTHSVEGGDCDDFDPFTHPERDENCDFQDNNCDGQINEGIACLVYAQSYSELYQIDPFLQTIETVASAPGLFDFDTRTDGALFGISPSSLYEYNESTTTWDFISAISHSGGSLNGFAIDTSGAAFATAGNNLYQIDLLTGQSNLIGAMGGTFSSSGDCVIDKVDGLYMTSTNTALNADDLVRINPQTGAGQLIGNTGYPGIYGLTFAWGYLFGFTGQGQLLEIDPTSGSASLLNVFAGKVFYGAASSPIR